jgi:hypothetical protein
MKLDLQALKDRLSFAHSHGYKVAYAAEYVADLGGGAPPEGVEKHSTEHLLHLISLAERGASAPQVAEAAPIMPPAPVAVEVVEAAPVEEPVKAEDPAEASASASAPEEKKSKKSKK